MIDAVGLRIVLGRQLGLGALPERARRIDLARRAVLLHQLDRKQDVVGIGAHDPLDLGGLEITPLRVLLQMQDDLGATRHPRGLLLARGHDVEIRRCPRTAKPTLRSTPHGGSSPRSGRPP